MCVLYAISIYTSYTEFTHYSTTVDCWSSWTSALKHVLYVSASCRNAGCKTFVPLFYGTVNLLLINLVPFIVMILTKKRHSYVTAHRMFNWFCQNQITISWHIHLQIYAESLVKFGQKVTDIGPYGKTNVSLSLFFWTQCVSDSFFMTRIMDIAW